MAAFQRIALASDAIGQWSLASSMAHLDICLRIGEENRMRGKSPHLAIEYDEVTRQRWAEMARAGVVGFDIDSVCLGIDTDARESAEVLLEQRGKGKRNSAINSGTQVMSSSAFQY